MAIHGRCHCENLTFVLTGAPEMIVARACGCSFCQAHGGVWMAASAARLEVAIADDARVSRYAFGTKTAEFLVCARCGVVPVVTSRIDGALYAVVNVNAFVDIDPTTIRREPVSFDGEPEDARLARRKRGWIADVTVRVG